MRLTSQLTAWTAWIVSLNLDSSRPSYPIGSRAEELCVGFETGRCCRMPSESRVVGSALRGLLRSTCLAPTEVRVS